VGDRSSIEWTDATWNPVVGCHAVSPGCAHCYAAREASGRLSGHRAYQGLASGGRFTGEVRLLPDRLMTPLRWRSPRWVFVTSMSDLWAPGVPERFVAQVFAVMAVTRRHRYQVLTKRPALMAATLSSEAFVQAVAEEATAIIAASGFDPPLRRGLGAGSTVEATDAGGLWTPEWPLPNVVVGCSIENGRYVGRADDVRATPASWRFLSLEPLLGPLPSLNLSGIDWVIVGGESGPAARPAHPEWIRQMRDLCLAAGVAFFLKQWGEWCPADHGAGGSADAPRGEFCVDGRWLSAGGDAATAVTMVRAGKAAAGAELDGRLWREMPAVTDSEARR
jgi:protein gp37